MPTNVRATRRSSDQVYVTWDPVSGVTTYLIYWAEEAAGPYELDGTANTPSHTSVNWEGYDYGYFKVSAVNAAGEGPQSAIASFGTYSSGESHSAPAAPSSVSALASSSSSITVSWSAVSGASGYSIYRALELKDESFSYWGNATSTSYNDTGLTQGTTYYYKIVAYNQYGESVLSTTAYATTSESIPSTPSNVSASARSSSSITVSWLDVLGVTSYNVYRSQTQSGSYTRIHTVYVSSTSDTDTSYTDTGLLPTTTYYYKVSASNGVGESPQSASAYATTWSSSVSSSSPPSAPTGVSAYKLSLEEVYVSWYPVSGAVEYVVYWATSAGGTYYYDGTTSDTYFISENWSGGTAYFKVTAVNSAGESQLSSVASVYLGEGYYSIGTASQNKLAIEKMR
jgi:fibronectin type 3 domain-containing protein